MATEREKAAAYRQAYALWFNAGRQGKAPSADGIPLKVAQLLRKGRTVEQAYQTVASVSQAAPTRSMVLSRYQLEHREEDEVPRRQNRGFARDPRAKVKKESTNAAKRRRQAGHW